MAVKVNAVRAGSVIVDYTIEPPAGVSVQQLRSSAQKVCNGRVCFGGGDCLVGADVETKEVGRVGMRHFLRVGSGAFQDACMISVVAHLK